MSHIYFNHSIFQQLSIYCLFNYRVSSKLLKSVFNRIKKIHKSKNKKKIIKISQNIIFFFRITCQTFWWLERHCVFMFTFLSSVIFFYLFQSSTPKIIKQQSPKTKIYKNCDWIFRFLLFSFICLKERYWFSDDYRPMSTLNSIRTCKRSSYFDELYVSCNSLYGVSRAYLCLSQGRSGILEPGSELIFGIYSK